jgi:hypothetical protein
MDHARETWQGVIRLGSRRGQKIDCRQIQAASLDRAPHRPCRHLGIGKQRILLSVDRVVARLDSVLLENAAPRTRRLPVDFPEILFHRLVVDGFPWKESAHGSDVRAHFSPVDIVVQLFGNLTYGP